MLSSAVDLIDARSVISYVTRPPNTDSTLIIHFAAKLTPHPHPLSALGLSPMTKEDRIISST